MTKEEIRQNLAAADLSKELLIELAAEFIIRWRDKRDQFDKLSATAFRNFIGQGTTR